LGDEIVQAIELNGYCIIENVLGSGSEERLDEVIGELKQLQLADKIKAPPSQVIDGILGEEGTSEIGWLFEEGTLDESDAEAIRSLNEELQYPLDSLCPYGEDLDLDPWRRTVPLAVRGGEPMEAEEDMTEVEGGQWLYTFTTSKLMVIYFLGVEDGSLHLQPYDEETNEVMITTKADMMVILRCDAMAHKHVASKQEWAICYWVPMLSLTGTRGWQTLKRRSIAQMPAVLALNDWVKERIDTLCEIELAGEDDDRISNIPREWQQAMHRSFFNAARLPSAIRGDATHMPGPFDCEAFFQGMGMGADTAATVPFARWNHDEVYDADPECHLTCMTFRGAPIKTAVKHSNFIEGVDLFDNKFFQISTAEGGGMDPCQRHILETSYEALHKTGYSKKQLMLAYIAVFTGSTNPEVAYIDFKGVGAGAASQAITSNRTSFVLGMMGPSTSIDCDTASAAMALEVSVSAVTPNNSWRTKSGGDSEAAICGGVYLAITPYMWPRFGFLMNPSGRCFTFDSSANGYIRGECCTSVCVKPYTELVDGEIIVSDAPCLGTIVGHVMTSNGKSSSITAPGGPGLQECLSRVVRASGLDALDVDYVDCHGEGALLRDSVEIASMARILRGKEGSELEPMVVGAVKANMTTQCEAGALTQFVKILYQILYATTCPVIGLKQINPHMEFGVGAMLLPSESLPVRDRYTFQGFTSQGLGGVNCHIMSWFMASEARVKMDLPESDRNPFAFWPGGGGMLEPEQKPLEGYYIIGSWNQWGQPEAMLRRSDGSFRSTVTLGVNAMECFQIWLDGESDKAIHPAWPFAGSGSAVHGPNDLKYASGNNWFIDGRTTLFPDTIAVKYQAPPSGEEGADALAKPEPEYVEVGTRDKGRPGDQYEVKLLVAGKYRAVSWKKVKCVDEDEVDVNKDSELIGSYYITGSCNAWSFSKMSSDPKTPTVHFIEVKCKEAGFDFQIVRNKDWDQRFCPPHSSIRQKSWHEFEADGPYLADGGHGRNWCVSAKIGDTVRVEFQRSIENGQDIRQISWRIVEALGA